MSTQLVFLMSSIVVAMKEELRYFARDGSDIGAFHSGRSTLLVQRSCAVGPFCAAPNLQIVLMALGIPRGNIPPQADLEIFEIQLTSTPHKTTG